MSQTISIYIHVPFCLSKCQYCDFVSYAGLEDLHAPYVDAVAQEAKRLLADNPGLGCRTVYLGGGTPSLLGLDQLATILGALPPIASSAEITVEANPGTVDLALLRGLRGLGVNRLSLGLQSTDDELLQCLGRRHSSGEALEAYRMARTAGFENISLDMMFGLPGQTLDSWRGSLERAIALGAEHLSLYGLTIEDGTPFGRLHREGRLDVPDDDAQADMFLLAEGFLEQAGYEHYEISNWAARRGASTFAAQHNLVYWRNEPYVGLGAAAHSSFQGRRFANTNDVGEYIAAISAGRSPLVSSEQVGRPQEMAETMMLGLRLGEGVDSTAFSRRFGMGLRQQYGSLIDQLVEQGLLVEAGDRVALSGRGRLLGNEVFARFLS